MDRNKAIETSITVIMLALLAVGVLEATGLYAFTLNDDKVYEITEVDVLSIEGIKSTQISVFGIRLGDSAAEVMKNIGNPNLITDYTAAGQDSINFEYKEKLNMTGTGLLINFENGKAQRITFKKPFNKYLHGKTVINHTKEDVYFDVFGTPYGQKLLTFFTVSYYPEQGFEVFVEGKEMNGFSLVQPRKKDEVLS